MAYPTPDQKQEKIVYVASILGCTAEAARDYLIAEEWDVTDAVISYRGDHRLENEATTAAPKQYFPMTVIEQNRDIGRTSWAIQYGDGRIVHFGFVSPELATEMVNKLTRVLKGKS